MKKLLVFIFLIAPVIFAQSNNKGNISFIFNNNKIDLPISSIMLRKDNNTVLTARAEQNNEESKKLISIEMTFGNDAFSAKKDPKELRLEILSRNNFQTDGEQLSIHYPPGNDKGELSYTVFNRGERLNLNLQSFHMIFNLENISYKEGAIKINGTFSLKCSYSLKQNSSDNNSIEVKDGKFEIII